MEWDGGWGRELTTTVGRPAAFVRSHTIGGENKRTKNTTMPLAIKTIEVQVIGNQ